MTVITVFYPFAVKNTRSGESISLYNFIPVIINCPRTIMTIKTVQRKEIQVTRDRHECLRYRDMSIYWRQSFVVNYDQVCRMKRKKSVILSIKSLNNKKIVTNFMTVNVAAPQLPNRQQLSIYKLLTN